MVDFKVGDLVKVKDSRFKEYQDEGNFYAIDPDLTALCKGPTEVTSIRSYGGPQQVYVKNPVTKAEIAFYASSLELWTPKNTYTQEAANLFRSEPSNKEIICNCSSRDLLFVGHKCGLQNRKKNVFN